MKEEFEKEIAKVKNAVASARTEIEEIKTVVSRENKEIKDMLSNIMQMIRR